MTRVPLNDLKRAAVAQRDPLQAAVGRVVDSGWYVHGPEHQAFEQELAAYLGVAHCVGVASGTDALELALRVAADRRRGVVVTAANAGGYTTTAARRAGLGLRFADVDAATLCLTAATVEPCLDADVVAVVVTHLYGRLAAVEELKALCDARGVPLVEDCAQAAGASRGGAAAGATGVMGTYSFYPTKNLGALGDGGAVVTSDDATADEIRRLRQYGWTGKYVIEDDRGRNSRLDELQAAVLRTRLGVLDAGNARRREIIAAYAEAAAGGPVRVLSAPGPEHVGHLAVALAEDRDTARATLADLGVATDVHYPVPDHRQPALAAEHAGVSLPVTEAAARDILTLPCFPELTDEEVAHVCSALAGL